MEFGGNQVCSEVSPLIRLTIIYSDSLKDQNIPGVTDPYVYVGSWKTMFCWHKEDMDLASINYLHYGKPKFWYGIDIRDSLKFESFLHSKLKDNYSKCSEFIRHKSTLVNPYELRKEGIRLVKMRHEAGEFMVQKAAAYHAGFNFGFNIAEAVNFALTDWFDIGNKAKVCSCVPFSVKINMRSIYKDRGLNPEKYLEEWQYPEESPYPIFKTEKCVQSQPTRE